MSLLNSSVVSYRQSTSLTTLGRETTRPPSQHWTQQWKVHC